MHNTRILVVDEHDVVRKGVSAIVAGHPEYEVCGEARSGREAISVAAGLRPDVVVMGISMSDMNGIDAARQILRENAETEVLVLTMHESDELVRQAFAAGVRGYVLKRDTGSDLMDGIDAVRRHRHFVTSSITHAFLRGQKAATPAARRGVRFDSLTPREREVVQLVADGNSNKKIAAKLHISLKTVETHRANVMNKLKLRSVAELVRYAIRNHIVEC
jgi:DNA-binding NarL/FixJ family response regulator